MCRKYSFYTNKYPFFSLDRSQASKTSEDITANTLEGAHGMDKTGLCKEE